MVKLLLLLLPPPSSAQGKEAEVVQLVEDVQRLRAGSVWSRRPGAAGTGGETGAGGEAGSGGLRHHQEGPQHPEDP